VKQVRLFCILSFQPFIPETLNVDRLFVFFSPIFLYFILFTFFTYLLSLSLSLAYSISLFPCLPLSYCFQVAFHAVAGHLIGWQVLEAYRNFSVNGRAFVDDFMAFQDQV